MNKAFEAIKNRFFQNSVTEDRELTKRRARPNRSLHRGQLKAMLKWEQSPIIAYK